MKILKRDSINPIISNPIENILKSRSIWSIQIPKHTKSFFCSGIAIIELVLTKGTKQTSNLPVANHEPDHNSLLTLQLDKLFT